MGTPASGPAAVSDDARRFGRLGRHLSEYTDKSTAGQAIAEAAVDVVSCTSAVVVHIDTGDGLRFQIPGVGPDHVIHTISSIVDDTGEGPARDAFKSGEVVVVDDVCDEARWPAYCARLAEETSLRSVVIFPLRLDGATLGLLCLYDERPHFFTDGVQETAEVYADHATIALSRVAAAEKVRNLETALESSRVIGEAIGILMARYRVQDDDAFALMRLASQSMHRKVRDLAGDIVREGDIPT